MVITLRWAGLCYSVFVACFAAFALCSFISVFFLFVFFYGKHFVMLSVMVIIIIKWTQTSPSFPNLDILCNLFENGIQRKHWFTHNNNYFMDVSFSLPTHFLCAYHLCFYQSLSVSLTPVRVSHLLCSTKLFHSVDGIIAGNFHNEPLLCSRFLHHHNSPPPHIHTSSCLCRCSQHPSVPPNSFDVKLQAQWTTCIMNSYLSNLSLFSLLYCCCYGEGRPSWN